MYIHIYIYICWKLGVGHVSYAGLRVVVRPWASIVPGPARIHTNTTNTTKPTNITNTIDTTLLILLNLVCLRPVLLRLLILYY